ncbi:PP2C family protein-serine/threonine phosphatase [Candidatus Ichthyocystis hellenicum]|uniref:PP2C family protein-serine/threonine phosphatase n=1 Tax=Candidatus Ichthyocystis hellenicum TaxID=1561003 RepID=UPI000A71FB45|nr:PP2C family protein-serine/threonine phosphatase [Candidatus Ichthyocystis hellenicum]
MIIKNNFIFRITIAMILMYISGSILFSLQIKRRIRENNLQILYFQGHAWSNLKQRALNRLDYLLDSMINNNKVSSSDTPQTFTDTLLGGQKIYYWKTNIAQLYKYFRLGKKELLIFSKSKTCGLIPDKKNHLAWFCSSTTEPGMTMIVFKFLSGDLKVISGILGWKSLIVDTRNHLLEGDPFDSDVPGIKDVYPAFFDSYVSGSHYLLLTQPLLNGNSSHLATLVSRTDQTDFYNEIKQELAVFFVLFGVFLGVIWLWLLLSVHDGLSWLANVYELLASLSRGEIIPPIAGDLLTHENESSQFFQLIYELRENRLRYDMFIQERDRVTEKRARLVRRQLEILAQTLDQESEEQIIQELRRTQQTTRHKSVLGGGFFSDFASFTSLFKKLTHMVVDQQSRLRVLLKQLQVALINEAQLRVLQQELDIARSIQEAKLPKNPPSFKEIDLFAKMIPFSDVGGDFYDYFELSPSSLCFIVADVSGKGIPAALFMVITRTLLRGLATQNRALNEVVDQLNELLCADNPQAMFVTLFLGVLDSNTGHLSYVSCGHPPPVLVSRGGSASFLPTEKNIALAVLEGFKFTRQNVQMNPGDVIFVYTDGLSESSSTAGDLYGGDRLRTVLSGQTGGESAQYYAELVLNDIKWFSGMLAEGDDTTCLVIRYLGARN